MIKKSKIHYRECQKFRNYYQIWSGTKTQNILVNSLILILFVRTVQPNRPYGYVAFQFWIQFASYFWLVYFEIWLSNLNFLLSIRLQHPAFLVLTKQKMCLPQEVGLLICCLSPSLPSRDSVNFSCKFEYWSPHSPNRKCFLLVWQANTR